MKKFLLTALILTGFSTLHAQSYRLIATAGFPFDNGGYLKVDTAEYDYSFGKGVMDPDVPHAFEQWEYDNMHYGFYDNTNGQVTDYMHYINHFDSLQRLNFSLRTSNSSGVWDTGYCKFYYYDSLDRVFMYEQKSHVVGTTFYPEDKITYTHGQYGVVQEWGQEWISFANTYQSTYRFTNTYTGAQLTQQIHEIVVGGWMLYQRSTYSYVGDNVSSILIEGNNSGWVNTAKRDFTYDVNGDLVMEERFSWDTSVWEPHIKTTYTYDNNHNMLTKIKQQYENGQYVNKDRYTYTYYPYNMVQIENYVRWDAQAGQFQPVDGFDYKVHFYYEPFDPTSTGTVKKSNAHLQVYPNPTSDAINITSHAAHTSPFSITIYDATGCSVRHWNEPPSTFYQKQIDVSQLASGNYFLRLSDSPQEAVQFVIVR